MSTFEMMIERNDKDMYYRAWLFKTRLSALMEKYGLYVQQCLSRDDQDLIRRAYQCDHLEDESENLELSAEQGADIDKFLKEYTNLSTSLDDDSDVDLQEEPPAKTDEVSPLIFPCLGPCVHYNRFPLVFAIGTSDS